MNTVRLNDCLSGVKHERARASLLAFLSHLEDTSCDTAGEIRQDKGQSWGTISRSERVDGQPRYARYLTGARHPGAKRNFALRVQVIPKLMDEFSRTHRVPNPYRPGCYHFIIESLKSLGVDRFHPFSAMRAEVEMAMGVDRWRAFADRKMLNARPKHVEDVEADAVARLRYNSLVLQRTRDYGLKLLQVGRDIMKTAGCVIDIVEARDTTKYRLNTKSSEPMRQQRDMANSVHRE